MRSISLKMAEDAQEPISYASLIEAVIDNPGERGTDRMTLRSYFPVRRALTAAMKNNAEVLYLEEADWAFLSRCLEEFRWGVRRSWLEDFLLAIENAPKIEPNEAAEPAK